ncbi:hypothetical protein ASPWEDRAFT_36538 [Aspergillus wentii DTO 134E9]|uniref:Uncharacterized protein n=1 Tax=Aspergillus wentii DTO 134E9 TaxID=1073089 RepID=A0A1L9RVB3_ASPWE|nr:uncharacterized protein ASPWEDRAFT_36538 [Aspergillus wentii DTO 134E9]OJJ38862.1 hypothetical protein ASPWEDRAFT_36538 [Aspergillus wentii DTO 134E9]
MDDCCVGGAVKISGSTASLDTEYQHHRQHLDRRDTGMQSYIDVVQCKGYEPL